MSGQIHPRRPGEARNVEEEADETGYWLELLVEAKIVPHSRVVELSKENNEIVAMTVASITTLRTQR